MRGLLYLLVATATMVGCQTTEKPSDRAHRRCAEETRLDPTLSEGNRWLETQNNSVYKEYMLCFCRKMGFVDEKGRFQKESMKVALAKLFPEQQLDEVVNRCVIVKGTPQESAYETIKCIDVNIPRKKGES